MKIFTSNYAKYKGPQLVRISKSCPAWANPYKEFPELYPSWYLISAIKNTEPNTYERYKEEEVYKEVYGRQLDRVLDSVIPKLKDGDVLCCFCKSGDFCHRHIVAQYLSDRGIECEEL